MQSVNRDAASSCLERAARKFYRGNETSTRSAGADYFVSLPTAGFYGLSVLAQTSGVDATLFVELEGFVSLRASLRRASLRRALGSVDAPPTTFQITAIGTTLSWWRGTTALAVSPAAVGRALRLRVAQIEGEVAVRRLVLWQATSAFGDEAPLALLARLLGATPRAPVTAALDVCELAPPVVAVPSVLRLHSRTPLVALQTDSCLRSPPGVALAVHRVAFNVVAPANELHRVIVIGASSDAPQFQVCIVRRCLCLLLNNRVAGLVL